jgi:hypothetical protein
MSKLAILAIVGTLATARPARASSCHIDCPPWLDVIGWGLALGLVGGYAVGTATFAYHDAADREQSINYGGVELGVNGGLAMLFGAAAIEAGGNGDTSGVLWGGALALVHTGLAVHGATRVYEHRDQIRMPRQEAMALLGLAYGAHTLLWAGLDWDEEHGRAYGIAEAAVNAPIAAGLGYLAYERASNWHGGAALGYGTLSVVSGALVIHGLRTALHREQDTSDLDVLGTDIEPTMVSDGIEHAPGIGARRTW